MAPNDNLAVIGGSYTPFQMNLERRIRPADDGKKLTTNIQPVIPFDISENWNLITRTIMPVSLQGGVGYWAESPDAGPEGLRLRLQANIVLPKLQSRNRLIGWGRGHDRSPFVSERDGLNLRPIGNRGEIMAVAPFNRYAPIDTSANRMRLVASRRRLARCASCNHKDEPEV